MALTTEARAKAKAKAAIEARVERLFYQYCTGIQIPVLKLPALFKLGVEAAEAGKDDGAIGIILYENAVRFGKENAIG